MTSKSSSAMRWPDYAAVWRWHFYAGLFCLPFVIWLAVTGSIYLFRPDIEAFLDRPYENLQIKGERPQPSAEVEAALRAVRGSHFHHYEPPATATGAAQVVVSSDGELWRAYIDPRSLRPMKMLRDDQRPMEVVSKLHGALLMGKPGSIVVEIAASWAIVLILTGIFLWFPRNRKGFAGIFYPRLSNRGRLIWRDLHAVTGMWVSAMMLFMLVSGLPWSVAWGSYLSWARQVSAVTSGIPNWTVGGAAVKAPSSGTPRDKPSAMAGMSAAEMAAMSPASGHMAGMSDEDHQAMTLYSLDVVVPEVLKLHVPGPVMIQPPADMEGNWTITSGNQDRTRRVTYAVSGTDGRVLSRSGFGDQNIVDRVVNVGISAHVGQLFGRINQAILLVTAISLIAMMIGAAMMWLKRKPADLLGAPRPGVRPRATAWLIGAILCLAVVIPLFALTMIGVLIVERLILRRVPALREWLGLREPVRA